MMNVFYCKCGWVVRSNVKITIECPKCHKQIQCDVGNPSSTLKYKPPYWIQLLKRLSKPEDIGLGATVKRLATKFGGERFKKFADKIGLPCGCTKREVEWNKLYPNPNHKEYPCS